MNIDRKYIENVKALGFGVVVEPPPEFDKLNRYAQRVANMESVELHNHILPNGKRALWLQEKSPDARAKHHNTRKYIFFALYRDEFDRLEEERKERARLAVKLLPLGACLTIERTPEEMQALSKKRKYRRIVYQWAYRHGVKYETLDDAIQKYKDYKEEKKRREEENKRQRIRRQIEKVSEQRRKAREEREKAKQEQRKEREREREEEKERRRTARVEKLKTEEERRQKRKARKEQKEQKEKKEAGAGLVEQIRQRQEEKRRQRVAKNKELERQRRQRKEEKEQRLAQRARDTTDTVWVTLKIPRLKITARIKETAVEAFVNMYNLTEKDYKIE